MDADNAAGVRGLVGLALAARIQTAFLDGIRGYSLLLDCELTRHDVANHVHVHARIVGRRDGVRRSRLIDDINYFYALIYASIWDSRSSTSTTRRPYPMS